MKYIKLQQGDVIIRSVSSVPKDVKKENHLILAHGESGHTHKIISGEAEILTSGSIMYLIVKSITAALKHEEHNERSKIKLRFVNYKNRVGKEPRLCDLLTAKEILYYEKVLNINTKEIAERTIEKIPEETIIPQGLYRIDRVLEWDYDAEEAKNIQD